METKSRYEVIAELELQKRDLIKERLELAERVKLNDKNVRNLKRKKDDTITVLDREIADADEHSEIFKASIDERKATIKELIKSIDDSLARFGEIAKSK